MTAPTLVNNSQYGAFGGESCKNEVSLVPKAGKSAAPN